MRRGGGRGGAGERGEGSAKRRETGPEDRRGGRGRWMSMKIILCGCTYGAHTCQDGAWN